MAKPSRLQAKQLELLGRLKSSRALREFYLVGGTAVGWHFGHRTSLDLDLFSKSRVPTLEPTVLWLTSQGATLQTESEVMAGLNFDGVRVDLVSYGYPPLEKPSPGPNGFPTASPLDLGVMKLSAIAKRGLRRDFWDLFVIVHDGGLTLDEILRAYRRRFDRGAADEYHLVRSLSYFVDAERDDPRVIGLAPHRWRAIKAFFESESRRLIAD